MSYEEEQIAGQRIAEAVEAETVEIERTLDQMIERLRDVDLSIFEIGFRYSKRDGGGYYVSFGEVRLGWIVKSGNGWTSYRSTPEGIVGKRVSNGTSTRHGSAVDLAWNVGSLAFDRYEFVSMLAARRTADYEFRFLIDGTLPELAAPAPEFDFETIEKTHDQIERTDQIVGVRIDGELVARFLDSDGKDWIAGSFYDGEGLPEDLDGSRTFVVRVVGLRPTQLPEPSGSLDECQTCGRRISDDDENGYEDESGQRGCLWHEGDTIHEVPSCFSPKFVEGGSVRFVETYSTGVLVDGGPTAPAGFETTVEETSSDGRGVLVRFPDDGTGFAPRQYVPAHVLEVEPDYSDATHCRHGSYVGSWAGPDYICGPCEDGLSNFGLLPSEIEFEARVAARASELLGECVYDSVAGILGRYPYSTSYAAAMIDGVEAALADPRPPMSFVRNARAELVEVGS